MLKWRPEGSDARHCGLMERSEGELERQQTPRKREGEREREAKEEGR